MGTGFRYRLEDWKFRAPKIANAEVLGKMISLVPILSFRHPISYSLYCYCKGRGIHVRFVTSRLHITRPETLQSLGCQSPSGGFCFIGGGSRV